jgi:hypothetical protein
MITGQIVAEKLTDYLHHRLTLEELVEWAEPAMMEEEFDKNKLETVRDIVSRPGLAGAARDQSIYLAAPSGYDYNMEDAGSRRRQV